MNRDEEFLIKRIKDLAEQSYRTGLYTYTGFLNQQEQAVYARVRKDTAPVTAMFSGGVDGCERQILRFGDEESLGYDAGFPICCIEIKPLLEKLGYTCTEYAFTDSNDVASVTQKAAAASDVMYIPTDNTAASCTEAIANVVIPAKVPVIAGEQGICNGCGVATLSIDYYELGEKTGEMAYEILANGANPGDMEVQPAPNFTKMYNKTNCEKLGITVPDDYTAIEG